MRPPTEDFELVAARRRWGARMLALWARPEPLAISAPPSQVSLTVIHVEAGAYLNVGGLIYDPRTIPAAPQQQAAITAEAIAEGGQ